MVEWQYVSASRNDEGNDLMVSFVVTTTMEAQAVRANGAIRRTLSTTSKGGVQSSFLARGEDTVYA